MCDAGNPIASLVSRLDLQRNRLWVKLRDLDAHPAEEEKEEEEEVEGGFVKVAAVENALFGSDSDAEEGDGDSPKKPHAQSVSAKGGKPQKPSAGAKGKVVEVEFDLALSAHGNARKLYTQKKVAYVKEAKTVEASAKVLQQVGERVLQGVENQKLKRNLRAVRKVFVSSRAFFLLISSSFMFEMRTSALVPPFSPCLPFFS
jgi:hypothetical protein